MNFKAAVLITYVQSLYDLLLYDFRTFLKMALPAAYGVQKLYAATWS
jgi:hypothetical protein